jgi:hypothetical protein
MSNLNTPLNTPLNTTFNNNEYEEVIQNSPTEWREMIKSYFESMNEMQKKTFLIAKNHLGTSFSIFKSNGFINFEKQLQRK